MHCVSLYSQGKVKECKGFFRWDVKTLTDSTGANLLSEIPFDSTISQLLSITPPKKFRILSGKDGKLPRYSNEKHLVRVRALIEDIQVKSDQDYHVIMRDPTSGDYMIGEIPDPDCSNLLNFPQLIEKYREARRQMEPVQKLLKEKDQPVMVEITGVPFWDARHWWLCRSAKTGREIHPILEVKLLVK